jgi:hypothetical protein
VTLRTLGTDVFRLAGTDFITISSPATTCSRNETGKNVVRGAHFA